MGRRYWKSELIQCWKPPPLVMQRQIYLSHTQPIETEIKYGFCHIAQLTSVKKILYEPEANKKKLRIKRQLKAMNPTNALFQTGRGLGLRQESSHSLNGLCILSRVLTTSSHEHVEFLSEEVSLMQSHTLAAQCNQEAKSCTSKGETEGMQSS